MIIKTYRKDDLDPELIINSEDIIGFKHTDEDYEIIINKKTWDWISISRENWVEIQKQWEKIQEKKEEK